MMKSKTPSVTGPTLNENDWTTWNVLKRSKKKRRGCSNFNRNAVENDDAETEKVKNQKF